MDIKRVVLHDPTSDKDSVIDSGSNLAVGEFFKLVPFQYDYISLTYVAAGNGVGQIETATYKTNGVGGTTVATLTLAYDANNKLSSVTRT